MNTKNVNSIGINEGDIQPSLVWNVNHSYLRDCETNIPCHNLTNQPKWPRHSSNCNDKNENGTIPENKMVRPKK